MPDQQIPQPRRVSALGDGPGGSRFQDTLESMAMPPLLKGVSLEGGDGFGNVVPLRSRIAVIARSQALRDSSPMQALFRTVRGTPDIFGEAGPVLERNREFRSAERPGEMNRGLSALFSSIAIDPRSQRLLDLAINREVERQGDFYWRELQKGGQFLPELIIGAGPNSSFYNSVRMLYRPDEMGLTVEARSRIGGQFAVGEGNLFSLNSRVRPFRPDGVNLPGGDSSLNYLGPGVLQDADLTNKAYGTNLEIATATRVNHIVTSRLLADTEVCSIQRTSPGAEARYIVELYSPARGETVFALTNRVVSFTGLGRGLNGLDPTDAKSQDIAQREIQVHESGGRAKFLYFNEAFERFADPTESFPLRDLSSVIVWGAKDSGNVIVGALLGYEAKLGKSVAQLDRVKTIYWVGQDIPTKEEFIECARARYVQLGLEFPRRDVEDYFARIVPVPGRAVKLADAPDGQISVEVQTPSGANRVLSANLAVNCGGFEDRSEQVLRSLFLQRITPEAAARNSADLRMMEGLRIAKSDGNEIVIDRIDGVGSTFTYSLRTIAPGGKTTVSKAIVKNQSEAAALFSRLIEKAVEVKVPLENPARAVIEDRFTGDRAPLALQVGASGVDQIYLAGPQAKLPLGEVERSRSEALSRIPENTAALFRYGAKAAALARVIVFLEDADRSVYRELAPKDRENNLQIPKSEAKFLPKRTADDKPKLKRLSIETGAKTDRLPLNSNREDLLRYVIAEKLLPYRFPPEFQDLPLTLRVSRENETRLKIGVGGKVPDLPAYREMINGLISDPLFQRVMYELCDKKFTQSGAVKISIPVLRRKADVYRQVDVAGITLQKR